MATSGSIPPPSPAADGAARAAEAAPLLYGTDLDSSRLFIGRIADSRLLFVGAWDWLFWDRTRWKWDRTGFRWRLAKMLSAAWFEAAQEAIGAGLEARANDYGKAALRYAQRKGMADVLELAKSDLRLVAQPEYFDTHDWLFNTPSHTVDLEVLHARGHDLLDMITKLAGAPYEPQATAPIWEAFLERIIPDEEVRHYLQKAVGYSLTGFTDEQCFFLLHGSGANGKSTFLGALTHVFGEYAAHTRPETFMARDRDHIPNDLAALAGTRLVITTEPPNGMKLNESLVKQLTGCDPITARFLHKEFFTFTPRFKVWMAANHLPQIRGTDHGMWRRIHLVPFTQTIPEEKRDPLLPVRLRREAAGILAWAMLGCMMWQQEGLAPPAAVRRATEQYRSDQDRVGRFLEEVCELDPLASVGKSVLWSRFKSWCEETNEWAGSQNLFSRHLTERLPLKEQQLGQARLWHWVGIGLRTAGDANTSNTF